MSSKLPKPAKPSDVQRTSQPPRERQREPAPRSGKRRKFRDVPGVQQALFDKGGDK